MLEIVKKRITLTKGDDASIWLKPKYKDKTDYVAQEGDKAYFRIKSTNDVLEIECNVNVDANKIVVSFVPDDTKDMLPGIYRYEAELVTSWNMHYTFLADQTFILGKELEKHVSNANAVNGNYGNNIPSVDGELEEEPVVDGDIQPTNPSLDYETLNHLPKINGHTLRGDMSNEQLGIPTELADMADDEEHRVVTDEQISDWNNKVEDDNYVHTDNNFDDTYKSAIDNLGTAATKNVPESGNASSSEVVLGNDTRLTDARPASDVSDWAKQPTKPSYNASEISGLGTAATKNFVDSVLDGSKDLVTSDAVHDAIANAISGLLTPSGSKTCAELVSSLLVEANLGNAYNMSDSGVTTADFVEGAGKPINVGDTVAIVLDNNTYKFDLLSGFIDLSNYVQKSSTSGLLKSDGSVDETAYAKQSEMSVTNGSGADADKTTIQLKTGTSATVLKSHQDISGKADKSEMSITDGAGADADKVTIQLKDGTSTKVLKTHQDISGKAEKSEMSVTDGTDVDADKTTIQLKSGLSATVLKTHQDISGKVDKVEGKGLSTNDYDNTEKGKVTDATNKLSTATQTVEGNPLSFTTLSEQNAESTLIDLEPIQDLHGYSKPWVGGAGKNICPNDGSLHLNTTNAISSTGTFNSNNNCDAYYYPTNKYSNLTISCVDKTKLNSQIIRVFYTDSIPANGVSEYRTNNLISGNYVSVDTSYAYIVFIFYWNDPTDKSLIQIESGTQATSYAPYENICPISGRTEVNLDGCGKNLIEDTTAGYVWRGSDGEYVSAYGYFTTPKYDVVSNERYSISVGVAKSNSAIVFWDKDGNYLSTSLIPFTTTSMSFTVPNNATQMAIDIGNYPTNNKSEYGYLQLEKGNQATSYEPYTKSNDLTISLGQTVYGGQLDVENGVLVVDRTIVDMGSLNWQYRTDYKDNLYSASDVTNYKYSPQVKGLCSCFKFNGTVNSAQSMTYKEGGLICFYYNASNVSSLFYINDDRKLSQQDFITAVTGQTICYELATPITIQLTPNAVNLLKGVNNVSTDGDNITLTYREGEVSTLGDLKDSEKKLTDLVLESQILVDTATGDKYILVVTNGVLDIQQVSN